MRKKIINEYAHKEFSSAHYASKRLHPVYFRKEELSSTIRVLGIGSNEASYLNTPSSLIKRFRTIHAGVLVAYFAGSNDVSLESVTFCLKYRESICMLKK